MTLQFDQSVCQDLARAAQLEWLETNGIGGFATGTVCGANTRRYHGLLVAAVKPPVGRAVLLSKFEETLIIDGVRFEFSCNQYSDVAHPRGHEFMSEFRIDPFPVITYEIGGVRLEKSISMVQGENTTVVQYALRDHAAGKTVELELRPLIAFRDFHATTHENGAISRAVREGKGLVSVTPYAGMPSLHLAHNGSVTSTQGDWYRRFQYRCERERGLEFEEDLFNPYTLRFDLIEHEATVIASTEVRDVADAKRLRRQEAARSKKIAEAAPLQNELGRTLAIAADQFIVRRGDQSTVIAGYPWFGDWGRDTMIALPGLALVTRRFMIAKSILREFSLYLNQGMLPNRFPDSGETPEYNTVDATLWYVEAVRAYLDATDDQELLRELYPKLLDVIQWHVKGTRHGIYMEADNGLLHAGEPGVQLTWMDAKVGDWVVTPRIGKPVEIQALWYNALRIMEQFAKRMGDETNRKKFDTIASLAHWSFNRLFWNEAAECLYDVTNGRPPDASIRPNQIFAVSLPYSMLTPERAQKVVEVVTRELLTPYGLRTLSPKDSKYIPRYEGGVWERDSAYHQGAVWPWLMGPYVAALLKVEGGAAREKAAKLLKPLEELVLGDGMGQLCELFDSSVPHLQRGCYAQAWSVSQLLEATVMVAAKPQRKQQSA